MLVVGFFCCKETGVSFKDLLIRIPRVSIPPSEEHGFVENKCSDWITRRGVTAHSSSGAEIWGAAWLTSLMWILPSHKTSKSAECVIILAANQPSICEWNYTTVSQRNLASSGLWDLLSFQFHLFDCNGKHSFFSKQFKFAYLLDFSIIA